MTTIDIDEYNYELEENRIAKFPVSPRDSSKLLVYKDGKITHSVFSKLLSHLPSKATLVFNDTKVIPARLHFVKSTGALIEIFLLSPYKTDINIAMSTREDIIWHCTIGNKKKWKSSEILELNINGVIISATLFDEIDNLVKFSWSNSQAFSEIIDLIGKTPLPPYMNREQLPNDKENYQTIYAEHKGAVAAPTAGLHFTEQILSKLEKNEIKKIHITLHVGAGTFQPVKTANAIDHPMHCENVIFSKVNIENLLENTSFLIPVGTTSMRSLESLYWYGVMLNFNPDSIFEISKLYPYQYFKENINLSQSLNNVLIYMNRNQISEIKGTTEIMIFPSYTFRVCKAIITNFHQPRSTLLLLISAFIGKEHCFNIYKEAIEKDYRFLSYGDSSLLFPTQS